MTGTPKELWNTGDSYEHYVGRWSRPVAREFLAWLAAPDGGRWLDVGCGTGALTEVIRDVTNPRSIVSIDPSADYIAHAESRITDPRIVFQVGSAQQIPLADGGVDVVVSGLMLNFVPPADQPLALGEMRRVARSGGTVAAYVWDYAGEMQLMRHFWDAAAALNPAAADLDEGKRFPLCRPDALADLFASAGMVDVETQAIDVPTVFRDFDDYWSPFLGGQGPAPGYAMSLDEDGRSALRDRIRAGLPIAADGSIVMIARAWAVRGVCPSG